MKKLICWLFGHDLGDMRDIGQDGPWRQRTYCQRCWKLLEVRDDTQIK